MMPELLDKAIRAALPRGYEYAFYHPILMPLYRAVAKAQRELIEKEGYVKLPTRDKVLRDIVGRKLIIYEDSGDMAEEICRWLQEGDEEAKP